jgi:aspartate/methionine/tyrosine aminotransferase
MKNRIESFILEFKAVRQGFSLVCYGAFFAYIRHHFPFSSWKVAESLAKRENILCVPGEAFGINQGNYLRFALGNVEKSCFGDLMLRLNRFTP